MTPLALFGLVAAGLFSLALYAVLVARPVLRKLVALNVMGTSVFLIFMAMAARTGAAADPVPHAMVLTGIVVTVGATGMAIALLRRAQLEARREALPDDDAGER
jgi:multicomponent Na+:H+ antiporter subunit C